MHQLTHEFVFTNGIRMHAAIQGQGPAVLLCHGFPETWYAWRHQLAFLSAHGYRAIAPDLRGYGDTDAPADAAQYDIATVVDDLAGLLDALGIADAVIVGNDWGANIAWSAAQLRPERFRAVAAIGVPLMPQPPAPPTTLFPQNAEELHYTLYFQAPGVAEREFERDVQGTLARIYHAASADAGPRLPGDGTPNPFAMVSRERGLLADLPQPPRLPAWLDEADLAEFSAAFSRAGFRGGLNYYRNLDRNWELMRRFDCAVPDVPALFLVGAQDTGLSMPGMRDMIAGMGRLLPQLTGPVELAHCGHWAPQEAPDAVNRHVLAFLDQLHGR